MSSGEPNFNDYPVRVTLHFRSNAQRDEFMGGLSDGFGENECNLDWPWKSAPRNEFGIVGFDKQERFAVDLPFDDNEFSSWEEQHAASSMIDNLAN